MLGVVECRNKKYVHLTSEGYIIENTIVVRGAIAADGKRDVCGEK